MAECNPSELISDACESGYGCNISAVEFRLLMLQLVCNLSEGGGGGSGGAGLVGVVDPEGVVTANPGTSYVNTVDHRLWFKESGTGNTGWYWYV